MTPRHATDLLIAFRQDAMKSRYATIDELYNYCHYSAVPVGRYVLDLHGESHACYSPSDALCMSLQILNHMQDCAKDLAELDRCYLPQALLDHFGASVEDLRLPAETPALRRVFMTLLDRIDRMNHAASELPEIVRNMRLRLETAIIHGLAKRLARRLAHNDPIAGTGEAAQERCRVQRPGVRALPGMSTREPRRSAPPRPTWTRSRRSCVRRARRSIMACGCCRRTAVMRCMRSTRSAGSSMTSPMKRATLDAKRA